MMKYENVYFVTGTAYAGKSTLVKNLAGKYDGILCEENYHDRFFPSPDKNEFPDLAYTALLTDWHDFVRRSPDEYERWIDGVSRECEILELRILEDLINENRPIFVDTNISVETLRKITDEKHVLIMLADPEISVKNFFDRPDKEKQFLYSLMLEEEAPQKALENFRECLRRINSPERYDAFKNCGFSVIFRDEQRTQEETVALAESIFDLERFKQSRA